MNNIPIRQFIEMVKGIDSTMEEICTLGACYQFAKFLKKLYPECELWYSPYKGHVIVKYENKFYDINGEYDLDANYCEEDEVGFVKMTAKDIEFENAEEWSFQNRYNVQSFDCGYCGETIYLKEGKPINPACPVDLAKSVKTIPKMV